MDLLFPSGRLARLPFVVGAIVIYVASFVSQALLSQPVAGHAGVWAFAAAQAVLMWAWYVIHVRRLHDAGRDGGAALGIAAVYALAILLLVLLLLMLTAADGGGGTGGGAMLLNFFIIVYLLTLLTADQALSSGFGFLVLVLLLLLILSPIVIAMGFSLRTALRPSVSAAS